MNKRPQLSFWQIWNMSFGFLGIQFGFALQNANVSRIFETLGASIDTIPILWLAAPITGLIIQPIIGHASDKTWCRLGRRRPYFLVGAILASLALTLMPNSSALWFAAGMLWIMDASINVSMEPFRAFVGDMLPSKQRTMGFAMQSFFIGTGAFVASSLPYILTNWFGIANTAPEGEIPLSVRLSFYIGSAVFITAILITVLSSREYSPEELEEYNKAEKEESEADHSPAPVYEKINPPHLKFQTGLIGLLIGIGLSVILFFIDVEKEVYVGSIGLIVFGILEITAGFFQGHTTKARGLVEIISDLNTMPSTMRQLAFVQFFSWFALFAMWIYTNRAVTSHIYGTTDPTSAIYNEGANWVGFCFGIYNLFAAIFAFLLIYFAKITSRKTAHMISLIVGGVSFISIFFIKDPNFLLFAFLGIGLTWASILAMPYAILTGSLPPKKMGVYMGIFNFFIVIPQILAGSILGFLVTKVFHEEAIYALVLGGFSLFIAAVLVLFVQDKK